MLLNCNALSNGRLKAANDDFKAYTKVVVDMKKDLDYIFKKIRSIRGKMATQYPDAVKQMELKKQKTAFSEEADEDDEGSGNGNRADDPKSQTPKPSDASSTVNYVQMKPNSGEGRKTRTGDESTDNSSSDYTADTWLLSLSTSGNDKIQ